MSFQRLVWRILTDANPRCGVFMRLRAFVLLLPLWHAHARAAQTSGAVPDNSISGLEDGRVPTGEILAKGAWSSASDANMPLPEESRINNGVFVSSYFGITYPLPQGWVQRYYGPPPSEGGRYVLAEISHLGESKEQERGNLLITADDLFFTQVPVENAGELIDYMAGHLREDYRIELPVMDIEHAGHSFRLFAYQAPVAQLHWYVVATDLRCHALNFTFTSREPMRPADLLEAIKRVTLRLEASDHAGDADNVVPVCMKNYANAQNLITRVEPKFGQQRSNRIPVRIVIDQDGRVSHIHILSAFPDQAKAIIDALRQWVFRPYRRNGRAVAVETGVVFGAPHSPTFRR
jgi:Gram-negative bacterial TonB protein C-terminal